MRTLHRRNIILILLGAGLILGCVWRFTLLHERFGIETLAAWGTELQGHAWTPFAVIGIFVVSGIFFFAHAALLWATLLTFDLPHAAMYLFLGSLCSAMSLYAMGRVLRRDVVARLAGSYMGEVSQALGRKGVLSIFLLHIFPVAPFSVLNLLAGATHIRFSDFLIGTLLGMTPGLLILLFFGERLLMILKNPQWGDVLGLALFVALGLFVLSRARRRLLLSRR